ncbi:MAG: serine/threonine-protein kinase [Planctomycetota bacterium]
MKDDLWQRARSVLEDLLDLDPVRRRERLDELRREDRALAELVGELLDADASAAESFLPVGDRAGDAPEEADRRRVGPFALVRRIATGRTSTIWSAERADGAFDQEVAIKLIDTDAVARDLGREPAAARGHERGLLARVDHPGVVRILDAGELEGGVEWIAMEHLRCEPMLDRADRLGLGIEERVRQVAALAEAVEACHRASVVHLDVAPGNAVATSNGEIKLIDFGSARLQGESATGADEPAGPVTPACAAPEQWTGQPVGLATDVHALGALLFLSLTGRPPFDVEGVTPAEAGRRVRWDEAPSPARVADGASPEVAAARGAAPRALARAIRNGGLDAVLLSALAKEPGQRTPTARAFADDLTRWLAGEPVHARRESTTQRVARLARRRPGATLAAIAAVVALLGGSLALFSAASRARAAETRERELEAEAERSLESLRAAARVLVVDVYESLLPLAGTRGLLDGLVEAGIEIAEGQSDPELSVWLGDALVKRSVQSADAADGDQRSMDDALADLDRAVAIVDPERLAHPAAFPPARIVWTAALARSLIHAGACRNDQARAALDRARSILEAFRPVDEDVVGRIGRANARASLELSASSLARNTGRWLDWRDSACERADAFGEVLDLHGHAPAYVEVGHLASSIECAALRALGGEYEEEGLEEALESFAAILEIAERHPTATNFVATLQSGAFALADWLQRLDDPEGALDVLRSAESAIAERIDSGGGWNSAGRTLAVLRTRIAREQIADQPEVYRARVEGSDPRTNDPNAVGEGLALLAGATLKRGDLLGAARLAERALVSLDSVTDRCSSQVDHCRARTEVALAQALVDERSAEDADGPRRSELVARALDWTRQAADWHARGTGDALHAHAMEARREAIERLVAEREAAVAGER